MGERHDIPWNRNYQAERCRRKSLRGIGMPLMLKEMAKRALAVVLLFLSATFIHAGAEERAPLERATWVWNNSITESASRRDDLLRFCAQRKIRVLFLYAPMDHLQERPEEFHAFLAAA